MTLYRATALATLVAMLAFPPVALAEDADEETEEASEDEDEDEDEEEGPPAPFAFLGDLRLNGRFDVAYERVGYTDDPSDGKDAFRNYHHFVFLTRRSASDPFFLTAELIDLSFYEFGASFRVGPKGMWGLSIRAGKLLIPFGDEPLFHHPYGGRSGFDQQVLPVVWAQHGLVGQVQVRLGPVVITDDLYVVQGFGLKAPEDVLNLQSDFSRADDARIGFGTRLSAGWGPITAWYSAYANSLGHDQWLFLQAFDIGIFRIPEIPFIEDLALSFGVMRADVSGSGPGKDYYHFADYVQLRYYPWDFLYVQLRSGMRTMNNRRGLFEDDTRLDENDTSSHNVGVVYMQSGFSLGLWAFFNLERTNEKDDDFLRVTVGYDF